MPELPEVETMVRGIRTDCTERLIEKVEFVSGPRRPISVFPDPSAIRRLSKGRRIVSISRLAKRIVLSLDSDCVVVIEPRMTGLLLVTAPPTADHRRLVWHFHPKSGCADQLEFWDRRGLGTVSLLTAEQFRTLQARLGPDALSMTLAEWRQRLKSTSREIKVALLDQHLVAGIGNLYASEILHRAAISPFRTAASLKSKQIEKLVEATQSILNEAIRYEGSTLNDGTYRNALNQDGNYQNHHCVYQKAESLCPRCGRQSIQRIVQAQRATFFCPGCQK